MLTELVREIVREGFAPRAKSLHSSMPWTESKIVDGAGMVPERAGGGTPVRGKATERWDDDDTVEGARDGGLAEIEGGTRAEDGLDEELRLAALFGWLVDDRLLSDDPILPLRSPLPPLL